MTRTTLTSQLAVAVALAATAAPSAWGRPADDFHRTEPAGSSGAAPPVRVVPVSSESDFDWGDAGAGAAFAATMLGLGGTFALRHHRRRGQRALEAAS